MTRIDFHLSLLLNLYLRPTLCLDLAFYLDVGFLRRRRFKKSISCLIQLQQLDRLWPFFLLWFLDQLFGGLRCIAAICLVGFCAILFDF
jgi:hypothetical protein